MKKICLKNIRDKLKLRSLIGFLFVTILVLFFDLLISSCDFCGLGPGDSTGSENEIYFTALPLNSDIPSIYAIGKDGESIREIVKNAILFSRPSRVGNLAYLRNEAGGTELRMINLDGSSDRLIIKEDPVVIQSITFPVISPSGNFILFTGSNNELWFVYPDSASKPVSRISGSLSPETLPTFSPDGRYFSFFEDIDNAGGFRIRVMNITDRKDVFTRNYTRGIKDLDGIVSIEWSWDSRSIIYGLRDTTKDFIIINDIDDASHAKERIFAIDTAIGAEMPVFSPDSGFFTFLSRKGDIFTRSMNPDNPAFKRLTFSENDEINKYPQWSNDGKCILFNNYFSSETKGFRAALIRLSNINEESSSKLILSNNVYRGFWNWGKIN